MNKIVLAVDGSEHSMRAAHMAGRLSSALGGTVDIVHVVSDSALVTPKVLREYEEIEDVLLTRQELLQAAGNEVVSAAVPRVASAGGEVSTSKVLVGSPAHQIAEYADHVNADCIVMGRRGLGDVAGLFMGSVSHRVGHLTPMTLVTTS